MWDTIINKRTEHIPYEKKITINEQRAPTDDFLKLLKEMEDAVLKRLIKSIVINDNKFNFVCNLFKTQLNLNYELHGKFSLNNEEHIIHIFIPSTQLKTEKEIVIAIYDALIQEISKIMTCKIMQNVIQNRVCLCL